MSAILKDDEFLAVESAVKANIAPPAGKPKPALPNWEKPLAADAKKISGG